MKTINGVFLYIATAKELNSGDKFMPFSVLDRELQNALNEAKAVKKKIVNVDTQSIEITSPFPSPQDWRDQWIYFIMVDRFNNPGGDPKQQWDGIIGDFQGGTFEGIRQQLGYLKQLGVGALWLTPVMKNCQFLKGTFHGYGIQDFLQIDPRFASNKADPEGELKALIDEAHARGIFVIFDIVLNHTGDVFAYILDNGTPADSANFRSEGYKINWRLENGDSNISWENAPLDSDPQLLPNAAVWPKELRNNEFFRRKGKGGEAGGDFESLKELVTDKQEVRNTLIRAYQYLIAKYDIDGFRIDTLKYIEQDFARIFGNSMREFALSIGKKNFFTFGEVYDDEQKIAHFIGRRALEPGDLTGIDAALDFPLFFKLPDVAKGKMSPAEVVGVYELRKEVQRGIISSHGEVSRFFVTFLDNHDMKNRFYHRDSSNPDKYNDQVTLGITCLLALQGIPCLYYGTEQGLSGAGNSDGAVREALWGKPGGFDLNHPFYQAIEKLSQVRNSQPALRYGRQYFRPISGDKTNFGISTFNSGVLAFSRILNDQEVVVVANTNTEFGVSIFVIVDFALNQGSPAYKVLYSNKTALTTLDPIEEKQGVTVREVDGSISNGPIKIVKVTLEPMEVQILVK